MAEKKTLSELQKMFRAVRNAPEEVHKGRVATAACNWIDEGFTAEQAKDAWDHGIYCHHEASKIRDADPKDYTL